MCNYVLYAALIGRERITLTTVQTCPVLKKHIYFQIFAREGFVKACPVGWISATDAVVVGRNLLAPKRGSFVS